MSTPLNPWKLSGFKPGQRVQCRVLNAEQKGYAVLILKENLPAFLPTPANLRIGEEILAQYVAFANKRIVLAPLVSNTASSSTMSSTPQVRWEDQLNQIGQDPLPPEPEIEQAPAHQQSYDSGGYEQQGGYEQMMNAQQPQQAVSHQGGTIITPSAAPAPNSPPRTQHLATHIQTPFMPPDANAANAESAFAAWAQVAPEPRKFHLKRATDLILPPLQPDTEENFKIEDYDLE
ncbi:MAG: hypothetical protein ACRD3W_06845, partial [Terriglobales bacterium]